MLAGGQAARAFGAGPVRHAIRVGRWQRPHPGVVVTHSGPLTLEERRLAAVIWAGPRAALSHATAAERAGLTGFAAPLVHVTIPHGSHSLPELEFIGPVRRAGLPRPGR